ncbi:unnamed protein product [Coffea canephora]|uniref:Uncharacterized protein n=1 Tax=Coffea canephora TaxID=49390 RepID=A0A068UT86_COFCA|nr:unnamed protein product [Coffea canephora]
MGKGEIIVSPFKKGREAESSTNNSINLEDLKKVYQQNNYINQILHTISQHMEVLNTKIDTIKKPELKFPNDISAPHFKPRSLTREKEQDLVQNINSQKINTTDNLLNKISQALQNLTTESKPSTPKINTLDKIIEENSTEEIEDSSEKSTESETEEDIILPIENQFEEAEGNQINRIKRKNYNKRNDWKMVSSKNYYPRPSPPDIQYEERSKFRTVKTLKKYIYKYQCIFHLHS